MRWVKDDGGRAAAGFRGEAGDCVARAVAIASGRPYAEVYAALAAGNAGDQRRRGRARGQRSARNGVRVQSAWFKEYMKSLGFRWVPTMQIGSGCTVHLADGELPSGRLVARVSKHVTAVIDGVIHDTYDPQRSTAWYDVDPGTMKQYVARVSDRCVYGYWILG